MAHTRYMDAPRLVSFLEYEGTSGVVRLGAGPYESVLSRPMFEPYMRFSCLEPPIGGVRFRSRYGLANVTPTGIEDVPESDAMVRLGAWIHLLNLYVAAARDLASEGARLAETSPKSTRSHLWLAWDVVTGRIRALERDVALRRLHPLHGQVGALVVEAVGDAHAMERMFSALRFSRDPGAKS